MQGLRGIALVGLPGCGKSTVAIEISRLLGWPDADLDKLVEQRTSKTILSWFSECGERAFRVAEVDTLCHVTAQMEQNPIVLATGGGAITMDAARTMLKYRWHAIHLTATVDTLLQRLSGSDTVRPMLASADTLSLRLEQLMHDRLPLYQDVSRLTIAVDQCTPQEIAQAIVSNRIVSAWWNGTWQPDTTKTTTVEE